jgi:hypothetical protein
MGPKAAVLSGNGCSEPISPRYVICAFAQNHQELILP